MGKKRVMQQGIFHLFYKKYYFKAVIFEYPKSHYLWIGVWMSKNQRGNNKLSILMNKIFSKISGVHEMHFFPEIHTLKKIAKKMKWKYIGKSNVFEECVKYEYISKMSINNSDGINLIWQKTSNFKEVRKLLYVNKLGNIVENYKTSNKSLQGILNSG